MVRNNDIRPVQDPYGNRPHRKLRISVTDRCNFRCSYCVPDDATDFGERENLLSFEEISRFVAEAAVPLGISNLRITGGEPLLRRNLDQLVGMLRAIDGVQSIGLTTNASRLGDCAKTLATAGVDRINISLDTLDRETMKKLTAVDQLDSVRYGIEQAALAPFASRKLNAVVIRGINDHELADLIRFAQSHSFEMRFIEFMPFGSQWSPDSVVATSEIVESLRAVLGPIQEEAHKLGETARRYTLADGTHFGIIPTLSQPFCNHCNRVRITASGTILPCLFAEEGPNVRALLRANTDPMALREAVKESLGTKGAGFLQEMADRNLPTNLKERDMRGIGG